MAENVREGNVRTSARALWTLLTAAFRADPRDATLTLLLDALRAITSPLYGLWLKFLVDTTTRHDIGLAVIGALGMAASAGIPWLAGGAASRTRLVLEERVGFYLERTLAEISADLPGLEHQERPEYLDKLYLIQQQQGTLGSAVGSVVLIVGVLIQTATVLVLLSSIHGLLLLLPLLGVPTLFAEQAWQRRLGKAEEESAETERLAVHLETLTTTAASAKELRVFRLQDEMLRRHSAALADAHDKRAEAQWKGIAWPLGAWVLFAIGFAGAVAFVAWRASQGLATVGDVVLAISLAGSARISISNVIRTVSRALHLLRAAERLLWLTDYSKQASGSRKPTSPVPSRIREGIAFEHVSFRYPGTDRPVLEDVSLCIPAGSVVALVGENGAGKTTLLKLLCRFYEPDTGSITVDGVDLREFDPNEWRGRISGAFQDFHRFELRAREAVGIGHIQRLDDLRAVVDALDRAGAGDLPAKLPQGLETQLGRGWEDGVDLSTGQWQKIALGRALMREMPLLLILDEPTASLDVATEYSLFEQMSQAARQSRERGAITLLVSHRFSTVRMADRIIVLSGGHIVEEGTHTELIARQGLYSELYNLQAESYR